MDKIIVNNQVVLMRKFVKQAKIHIINKCAKKIKALQSKKGNESQMLKCQRKVERLLKEIAILKNMKLDLVSKLALSKAKDWESLLKQKTISLEERCLSMLANYTAVKKEVDKFHFNQSHLVSKIPAVLLEWEAKSENPSGSTVKNSKGEFRNASFPNNIKVAKRAETVIRNKSLLPHLALNSAKIESKQVVEQHTLDSEALKPGVQSEIKFKNSLNQKNTLAVKKEKSKKLLRYSNDSELLEEESKNFQSSNNENEEFLEEDSKHFQSPNITDNEDEELFEEDSKNLQSLNIANNEDDIHHTKNGVTKTIICKRKKQKLTVNKNKHIVSHGVSDIEMQESDENSNHQSEMEAPSSPVSVAEIKVPENTKKSSNDKHICKQLNLKKYLRPLKSTPKSDVSVNNQSTIFSKLEAISRSDLKKPDLKNTKQKNTKAITVLDLNKLQDLDEIPLEKSPDLEESSEEIVAHKSDSFFLTADDSKNEDIKNTEENTAHEMPFKAKRGNMNKRISDFNFREKPLTNKASYKFQNNFKSGVDFNMERNKQFWKQSNDSNFNYKNKFKGKEVFSEKNQFGNKRNFRPEMKKPSSKNQKNLVSKTFPQDKVSYINKELEDKKPIHPSWEAKQKLKETLKIGFQGKRIVFD